MKAEDELFLPLLFIFYTRFWLIFLLECAILYFGYVCKYVELELIGCRCPL